MGRGSSGPEREARRAVGRALTPAFVAARWWERVDNTGRGLGRSSPGRLNSYGPIPGGSGDPGHLILQDDRSLDFPQSFCVGN